MKIEIRAEERLIALLYKQWADGKLSENGLELEVVKRAESGGAGPELSVPFLIAIVNLGKGLVQFFKGLRDLTKKKTKESGSQLHFTLILEDGTEFSILSDTTDQEIEVICKKAK